MDIRLSEHKSFFIRPALSDEQLSTSEEGVFLNATNYSAFDTVISKPFNTSSHCFIIEKDNDGLFVKTDYCIGLDWLGNSGRSIYVEPKVNLLSIAAFRKNLESDEEIMQPNVPIGSNRNIELDYVHMLLDITSIPDSMNEVGDLVKIDWNAKRISISQKQDKLTPFMVVRYLQILKSIVRKGLKKNYYKVQENLNGRLKGKILLGQHIKQNVLKSKLVNTFCEFQEFGFDHLENQFLKKVLQFVSAYVSRNKNIFRQNYGTIQDTIAFCRPAFEKISNEIPEKELKYIKHNPFYKDYKDAIKIGGHILKRFSYNITRTSEEIVEIPPFWIDMPKLFELYVFSKMIAHNQELKNEIHYQFSTYGNVLDILISHPDYQMVIDAKYKLHYQNGVLHNDIRQVAGYARLNKVRKKLNVSDDSNIKCLIIYPDIENGIESLKLSDIINTSKELKAYYNVYKIGVKLPWI